MTLGKTRTEFCNDVESLREYALEVHGLSSFIDEVKRTLDQQKIYVASGRSKTMHSAHLQGRAADLQFFDRDGVWINGLPGPEAMERLRPIGVFWEGLNRKNVWGGNFDRDWERKDPWIDNPHFERMR